MTVVPLPDTPCVRVRVSGTDAAGNSWGTRFYLSYSGSAPSGANCATLASDIASSWNGDFGSLIQADTITTEVDVLDIATDAGLSGQWTGSDAGSRSGDILPAQTAMNVEYGIARRYRGGKPRAFFPLGVITDLSTSNAWAGSFLTATTTAVEAFFTAIAALDVGSMGTLAHVNLSYYKGFTNITNSSGRERAVPTYRATALHDVITGYFPKSILGSQRRRRTSTAP